MADNGGSSNTAIVAIFVLVILLGLGFLFFRGFGSHRTTIEVRPPEVSRQ
jgi:hypothetical protein